jgi:hypothetical protein
MKWAECREFKVQTTWVASTRVVSWTEELEWMVLVWWVSCVSTPAHSFPTRAHHSCLVVFLTLLTSKTFSWKCVEYDSLKSGSFVSVLRKGFYLLSVYTKRFCITIEKMRSFAFLHCFATNVDYFWTSLSWFSCQ